MPRRAAARVPEEGPWHIVVDADRTLHATWHPSAGFGGWPSQAACLRYAEEQAKWGTAIPRGASMERCVCNMTSEFDLVTAGEVDFERDQFYDGAHTFDPERREPQITREPVNPPSTDLVSVGWAVWDSDGVTAARARPCALDTGIPCGVMEVEFKNGAVYRYYHVGPQPALVMQGKYGRGPLESVGKFFHASIRRNDVIPYRKLPATEPAQ